jgi:hypothetical protein
MTIHTINATPRHPLHCGLLFALSGGRLPGAYALLEPGVRRIARIARRAGTDRGRPLGPTA